MDTSIDVFWGHRGHCTADACFPPELQQVDVAPLFLSLSTLLTKGGSQYRLALMEEATYRCFRPAFVVQQFVDPYCGFS